jgi:hypothetical protein
VWTYIAVIINIDIHVDIIIIIIVIAPEHFICPWLLLRFLIVHAACSDP